MTTLQKKAAREVADLLDGDGEIWQIAVDAIDASRREGRDSDEVLDDLIATLRELR